MNNIIKRKWNQNSMVIIEDLQGMAFQAESGGHTFQISGIDGEGNTVALSGTPAGVMLRSDGQDVTLTCSVSEGVVSATLPANAYVVPGRFGLTIFLTSDGQKTAIYAAVGTVGKTSSGTVAPPAGSDVVTLVNQINTAIAAIPANYNACFAPAYSTSGLYSVGQYVMYNGSLYRCTTAITSGESWTAAHWTQTNMGDETYALKSALNQEIDLLQEDIGEHNYFKAANVSLIDINGDGTYRPGCDCGVLPTGTYILTFKKKTGTTGKLYVTTVINGTYSYTEATSSPFTFTLSSNTKVIIRNDASTLDGWNYYDVKLINSNSQNILSELSVLNYDIGKIVNFPKNLISSNNPDCTIKNGVYYDKDGNNHLSENSGQFVAVLLKAEEFITYTVTRVGYKCFFVAGDGQTILDTFIGYQGTSTNTTFKTVSGTKYIALNFANNYFTEAAMCSEGTELPSSYERYYTPVLKDDIALNGNQIAQVIENIEIPSNVVTVKKDGTGDYTKLSDAVSSIQDSSASKRYKILIYSGTYDIIDELGGQNYIDSITGEEESMNVGLLLPPYVDLIGIGDVLITAYGGSYTPTNNFGNLFSAINVQGTNTLKNLKIKVNNCRYAVHDETNGDDNFSYKVRNIIGCEIVHDGNSLVTWSSPNAYAVGFDSGDEFNFENTYFYSGAGNALSFHDRGANVEPSVINIKACSLNGQSENTLKFGSVGGAYQYVNIVDSYIQKGIQLTHESGGNYCNFILKGSCNKEIKVKYLNNIPLIQNYAKIIAFGGTSFSNGQLVRNTASQQMQVTTNPKIAIGVCIDADNRIMQKYGYVSKSLFTDQSLSVGDTICMDNGNITINGNNPFAIYDGQFENFVLLKFPLNN